jgi:hypothetical protein
VASGVRFVGFNIRKANNRQGPGLFDLSAGKLTVVLADTASVQAPMAATQRQLPLARTAPAAPAAGLVVGVPPTTAALPSENPRAAQRALNQAVRERAKAEAAQRASGYQEASR